MVDRSAADAQFVGQRRLRDTLACSLAQPRRLLLAEGSSAASNHDRKAEIRARMARSGEPYNVARRAIENETVTEPAGAAVDAGVPAEERGVGALPAGAVWRPVGDPDTPCRCSGTGCRHGVGCERDDNGEACPGRMLHIDRYPGSTFAVSTWWDEYVCDTCDRVCERSVELPGIPWGEHCPVEYGGEVYPTHGTRVYDGVRHPHFPEIPHDTPQGNGTCHECGGYAHYGPLCDCCRRDGWSDSHGTVEEPDEGRWHDDQDDEELATQAGAASGPGS
ncbi:MAG: hypothetical protein ACRDRS_04350 [Pseudonocardiaceae bacterium]